MSEVMVRKKGGWDRKPVAGYDCRIQLITDADFHKLAVASYCVMFDYAEMMLSLNILNILHDKPEAVE